MSSSDGPKKYDIKSLVKRIMDMEPTQVALFSRSDIEFWTGGILEKGDLYGEGEDVGSDSEDEPDCECNWRKGESCKKCE